MDIKQLNYFINLIDHGSFSNAAKSLFITQPSLSQALKKMEQELGVRLYSQTITGIVPTCAGQYLYDNGRPLVDDFEKLVENVQNLEKPDKTVIRLGIPTLFAMQYMTIFSEYLLRHPNVDLTLVQGGSRELQEKLVGGDLDLGIISYPIHLPNISILPLERGNKGYHACVVAHQSNPISQAKSLTFDDIRHQKFSSLTPNYILGALLHERAKELGFSPDIVYSDDNWVVLLSSLKTFQSICILASEQEAYSNDEELVWIPLIDKKSFHPIGIATSDKRDYSQELLDLIEAIKES